MTDINVITEPDLGGDFRGVGTKIVNDSILGGAGPPTTPPAEPGKIWQWWNTADNQITHAWSVSLNSWVPLSVLGTASTTALVIKSTDTTTNLTGTTSTPFDELFGGIFRNEGGFNVNLATAEITLPSTGWYEVHGYWSMIAGTSTNAARNNIRFWFTKGGNVISPNYQNNYVRDATGHNEIGQGIPGFTFQAAAGETIQLWRQRVGGSGGAQTLQGANNYLSIRRT